MEIELLRRIDEIGGCAHLSSLRIDCLLAQAGFEADAHIRAIPDKATLLREALADREALLDKARDNARGLTAEELASFFSDEGIRRMARGLEDACEDAIAEIKSFRKLVDLALDKAERHCSFALDKARIIRTQLDGGRYGKI